MKISPIVMDIGDFSTPAGHDNLTLFGFPTFDSRDGLSMSLPDISDFQGQDPVAALASAIFAPQEDGNRVNASMDVVYYHEGEEFMREESQATVIAKVKTNLKSKSKPQPKPALPSRRTRTPPGQACSHFVEKRTYCKSVKGFEDPSDSMDETLPKKRKGSSPAASSNEFDEEDFSPTEEEIELATSLRSQRALESWYLRMNELSEFKKKNGHTKVPQKYSENPKLGVWVNKQREELKNFESGRKTSLTETRINTLDSIGFFWGKRKGSFAWQQKFEELKEFKRRFGHCNVWTKFKENRALGRWVSTQRRNYKLFTKCEESNIDEERIEQLEALGFVWNMTECNTGPPYSLATADKEASAQNDDLVSDDAESRETDARLPMFDPMDLDPILTMTIGDDANLQTVQNEVADEIDTVGV